MEQHRISQVTLGDCMDGMKQYPNKWFDLAVVDPPYGIGAGGKNFQSGTSNNSKIYRANDWDSATPTNDYWVELKRVSKNQIVWGGNYFLDFLGNCRSFIFWDKNQPMENYADGEFAWTSFDRVAKCFKNNWYGVLAKEKDQIERIHPTQKPIALYDWIYKNYLPQGGKVIDTHLGSGSNRIAANKAGNIDFTGFELDKDYYEAQEKRWKGFISQTRLF